VNKYFNEVSRLGLVNDVIELIIMFIVILYNISIDVKEELELEMPTTDHINSPKSTRATDSDPEISPVGSKKFLNWLGVPEDQREKLIQLLNFDYFRTFRIFVNREFIAPAYGIHSSECDGLYFISHKWISKTDPGDEKELSVCFDYLRDKIEMTEGIFFDYSCLRQNFRFKRKDFEERLFKSNLNSMNELIKKSCCILLINETYFSSKWCICELIMCLMSDRKHHVIIGDLPTELNFLKSNPIMPVSTITEITQRYIKRMDAIIDESENSFNFIEFIRSNMNDIEFIEKEFTIL